MSRIPFISAFLISIALVGGAMWFRLFPNNPPQAQVVAVSQIEPFLTQDASLEEFFSIEASLPAASTTPLSQADMVGRQLFSDFMSLKSRGEVTSAEIDLLADKYAAGINNFEVTVPKVNIGQVVILPDSEENLAIYGQAIIALRSKYQSLVALQAQSSGGNVADVNSQAFSTFMSAVAKLYKSSADELLATGVPTSLAANHVNLINNYLESAEVMGSLSNGVRDSVKAFAALNLYAQHTGKESELLFNIQKTLMANGIIFNSSL